MLPITEAKAALSTLLTFHLRFKTFNKLFYRDVGSEEDSTFPRGLQVAPRPRLYSSPNLPFNLSYYGILGMVPVHQYDFSIECRAASIYSKLRLLVPGTMDIATDTVYYIIVLDARG